MMRPSICLGSFLLVSLVACSASPESVARRAFDLDDEYDQFDCQCDPDPFPTATECVADRALSPAERECLLALSADLVRTNQAHIVCLFDAVEADTACEVRAGCEPSDAALAACDAAYDAAVAACGSDDPCFGLSGDALASCRTALERVILGSGC